MLRSFRLGVGTTSRILASVSGQALSSLTNFVVLFTAIRTLNLSEVGRFTFAYTAGLMVLVLVRSLALEPLLVRFSDADETERRMATEEAGGLSLVTGLVLAILALAVGTSTSDGTRLILLALAFAVVFLLVQDAWRFHFFAGRQPWKAAANDAVCLGATIAATAISLRIWEPTVASLLVAWGAGNLAGAVAGAIQTKVLPHPGLATSWLKRTGDLGFRFLGESALERLLAQASFMVLGVIAGVSAMGQVGAARTLLTPTTTLINAVNAVAVPEAVKLRSEHQLVRLKHLMWGTLASVGFAVALISVLIWALPLGFGEKLVGPNWGPGASLALPLGLGFAALGAREGPRAILRAYGRSRLMLRLAMVTSPLLIAFTALGALIGGAHLAVWAMSAIHFISLSASLWAATSVLGSDDPA